MKSLFLAMCAWCCRASLLRIRGENGALHFGPESDVKFLRTAHGNLTLEGNLVFADSNSASTSSLLEMLWEIRDLRSSVVELASTTSSIQADVTSIQADISSIQADVTTLEASVAGDISSIQADVTSAAADISSIQADVTTLEASVGGDISNIQADVTSLEALLPVDALIRSLDQVAASSEVVVEYIHA